MNLQKKTQQNLSDYNDGATPPKLVFSDDALVVDYLNALLASSSSNSEDSAEIHFVHLANATAWKPGIIDNRSVVHVANPEIESSKMEAVELRKINEHLKFKTELAEIDSQVLRSENNHLKAEIAIQSAQLLDMQKNIDTISKQNIEFQSKIDKLKTELELSFTQIPAEQHKGTDTQDEETNVEIEVESSLYEKEIKLAEPEPELKIKSELKRPGFVHGVDEDTAIISHQQDIPNNNLRKSQPESLVFSVKQSNIAPTLKTSRNDSKIIKQFDNIAVVGEVEIAPKKLTPMTDLVSFSEPSTPHKNVEHIDIATIPLDATIPEEPKESEQHIADVENFPNELFPNRDCTDEIEMESTPAPKVVVQRNVLLYENIQKEAERSSKEDKGHGIVL